MSEIVLSAGVRANLLQLQKVGANAGRKNDITHLGMLLLVPTQCGP